MPLVASRYVCASCRNDLRRSMQKTAALNRPQQRRVQISATPAASATRQQSSEGTTSDSDARFEVLGTPYSLLSASIAASQNLYTRKGTLVGFQGKAENVVSTLSALEPFRRALVGIPFLYQRIQSTTPYTALIATRSPITSLSVIHLDGRVDWMVAQRNALLAWTGHTLNLSPRFNTSLGLTHWGSTSITGRGLMALAGKGTIYQVTIKAGEEYVLHPANLVAYTISHNAPQPYRFKANLMRFQIPSPSKWLPDTRFWRSMRETATWRFFRSMAFMVRTWARRTIWGDRLFLHFHGPATVLIQSRSSALRDVLTSQDVNELAESPAGVIPAVKNLTTPSQDSVQSSVPSSPTRFSVASVDRGSVKFEEVKMA